MAIPSVPLSPTLAPTANKAHAAGGAVVVGEALAQIAIHVLRIKWPQYIDEDTAQSIAVLVVAGVTWFAVYVTPT
jgi:hypothetical protein